MADDGPQLTARAAAELAARRAREAAALRANLRRRKQQRQPEQPAREPGPGGDAPPGPRAGHD